MIVNNNAITNALDIVGKNAMKVADVPGLSCQAIFCSTVAPLMSLGFWVVMVLYAVILNHTVE
jgi:hypothetical protein